jgi:restriction system protein
MSLHSEVFEHFAGRPDDMQRLGWRDFEELLDSVFKNQGFYTELGPGSNDGGIDLRIYQSRAIPEVVTLVQAKRYSRAIDLQAVAALFGVAVKEKAEKAIFATTSYFLPGVIKWASSGEQQINWPNLELVDATRIAGWCADIGHNLDNYFSNGLSRPQQLSENTGPLTGEVVVAQGGYNCTQNYFAIIEADLPNEVILRPIGSEMFSGDGTDGSEIASENQQSCWTGEARLLGFKESDGSFRADRKSFALWDRTPQMFNSD